MPPTWSSEPLKRIQQVVLGDVTGVEPRGADARAQTFAAPPAGTVEDRWAIYTSGYLARLVEALENDYPALRRVLGEGPFRSLTARYSAVHRPRSYDLGRAGDRLAGFLGSDPLAAGLPFLPDLARLEWAVAEAFVAPDARPVTWEELAREGPSDLVERPLGAVPGTALVRSDWPLLEIWRLKDIPDEEVSLDVAGRPSTVLVFRRGLEVRWRELDALEARLVEAALAGAALADLEVDLESEQDASRLVAALQSLVVEGLIANPLAADDPPPS